MPVNNVCAYAGVGVGAQIVLLKFNNTFVKREFVRKTMNRILP